MDQIKFPREFMFGAATSAFQIEGACSRDGKGPSIWDNFTGKKGKIRKGHNALRACEHYDRYREDVAIMKELGLDAYRFSISWPRIMPEGRGEINRKGLDYYSALTDALLEAGIDPFVTLFHWDLPLKLQEQYRGFESRTVSRIFADYAEVVVRHLGDRVKNWITINEPWEFSCMGHFLGEHAPGRTSPWAYFKVMHNVLLAHGYGMQVIRTLQPDARAGITVSMTPIHPMTDSPKDTWSAMMANQFMNHITLSPLYHGAYPEPFWTKMKVFTPEIEDGDMDIITTGTDFIGLNNYQRERAMHKWYIPFFKTWITGSGLAESDFVRDGVQYTSMGWEVHPPCIYECLKTLQTEYGNPTVYITENGAAFDDIISDGRIRDTKRIDYLQGYLSMVNRARLEGADVRGYFVWSLMDNFEWAAGLDKRFGIVHVDFETQKRTIKDSGRWYAEFISTSRS